MKLKNGDELAVILDCSRLEGILYIIQRKDGGLTLSAKDPRENGGSEFPVEVSTENVVLESLELDG